MTPWRIGRGWSEAEIQAQLAALADRSISFTALPGGLPIQEAATSSTRPVFVATPGWTLEQYETTIGIEPPGPPVPDWMFTRSAQAIQTYQFADPRITDPHFDPRSPLVGRDILMDARALAFRFLVGLRVGAVLDEPDGAEEASYGIRVDTLEGHLLHGSEWIIVAKNRRSGAVRLRILVRWQPAPPPAWWMAPGARLFGDRIRARWRRQAARRLRALV